MYRNVKNTERSRQMDRLNASIPCMPRAEYLRKYPKGGPERFSGLSNSEEYREYRAAVKRRDRESRRPGWLKFWWAMAALSVVFTVLLLTLGLMVAVMSVLILAQVYCLIEMGMNLPR